MKNNYEPKLIDDWKFDEVASALQKCIRRGLEYDSCFFAYIFHKSGFGPYLWRRLSIICSEDVGNGDPFAAILLNSLKDSWTDIHKQVKEHTLDKFILVTQAILYLCRSEKSRETDNLTNLIDENYKSNKRIPMPEIAICPHTKQGRKVWGRFGDQEDGLEATRIRLWKNEWSKLDKLAYPDKWEDAIIKIWLAKTEK